MKKNLAFTINTLEQAEQIILETKKYNIKPVLHFKNYILKGFGPEFVIVFNKMLITKFGKSNFKLFVDCGYDSIICINMAIEKIDYLKLRGNSIIISKIKNIAIKNRVLLNKPFHIVDFRNRKNVKLKLEKIYFKEKK